MKKFFVALLMLLTIPAFATGVGSTASTADCDNATLNTYTGTSNLSAGWQPNTIALHWYNGDTEITSGVQTSCVYDGTLTPPATIPTKTGYTFKGWTVRPDVPSGYTRLEYIESSGTQYIDTGITSVVNAEFGLIAQQTKLLSGFPTMVGANDTAGDFKVVFGYGSGKFYSQCGNGSGYVQPVNVDKNKHTFVLKNTDNSQELTVDNITISGTYNITTSTNYPLCICARNTYNGVGAFTEQKVYSFYAKKNNNMVQNLIPAKRNSDNVVGMWDTVSKTFFTNAGTGSFIAGPVVSD